jgi:large subunit ribosomal protein L21
MYAVIKTGGKQYKVSEGEILEIDKLQKNPGEKIEFGEVLLVVKNGEVKIGQPTVPGTKVTAKILEQIKGEKIRIARFKAKVRYRRVKGFRPQLTRVKIEKIG